MTGIKEALGLQCNLVIPARDAGIQGFYQVGKHKSYVKIRPSYGKAGSQCRSTGMTEGGYLDDRRRATWMTPNWMTRELRSHHKVPGLCSKTKQTLLLKK